MAKMYEEIRFEIDPFCIMCGEGPMEEITYWVDVTEEQLRETHEEQLSMDKAMPEFQIQQMKDEGCWVETEEKFEDWLEHCIKEGYVREKEEK